MSIISEKTIRKLENKVKNGTRTIFVEGPADVCLYERFYPNSDLKHFGSSSKIIEVVNTCNSVLGKTPFIVGIIDKDLKLQEDIKSLEEENIFVLKEREIESIFLRQDVIQKLFGNEFFERFLEKICIDATNRTSTEVWDYEEALSILKCNISSKYSIRLLIKLAGIKQSGNKKNIEFLCSKMDEKNAWGLVEDIIPKLPEIERGLTEVEKFQARMKDFIPNEKHVKLNETEEKVTQKGENEREN